MKSYCTQRLNYLFIHNPLIKLSLFLAILLFTQCSKTSNVQSILIKNGKIVNYNETIQADILITGEKIVEIGTNIKPNKNTNIIDASGMEILPGGIDPHVHITGPFADDFTSASKAALAGGITTIGDITFPKDGQSIEDRLKEIALEADSTSSVDVMITPNFPSASSENQKVIQKIASKGYTSLKIFTVFEGFNNDKKGFAKLIELSKKEGVLPMLHCEDFELIKKAQDSLISEEKTSIYYYAESRPVEAEIKATEWAIQQSETLGAPVYIVHLSSAKALELCREAQKRGVQVFVETRPIYLYFTKDVYKKENGQLYTGMPVLRSKDDIEALWQGLFDGTIHTLGSDHAPWTLEQKLNPENNIIDHFSGSSNLQLMLPMLYSEGVLKNRINIERFVEVTSTNAAKLFGLFPRKGIIAVGSDADIVIWDKNEKKLIDKNFGYSKAGFSIYNDFEVTGWPKYTIRRGEILLDDGELSPNLGNGLVLTRNRWQ